MAELLGVPLTACTNQCSWMHKAERCSGLAERRLGGVVERRLGGVVEAAELCGAAELLGVPLTLLLNPGVFKSEP